MNGEDLLPDHGYPLRLVLPGWVGVASIKWLGSLEVSTTQLTSPWNTQPLEAAFNTQGYFFDAVVRHPVQVV